MTEATYSAGPASVRESSPVPRLLLSHGTVSTWCEMASTPHILPPFTSKSVFKPARISSSMWLSCSTDLAGGKISHPRQRACPSHLQALPGGDPHAGCGLPLDLWIHLACRCPLVNLSIIRGGSRPRRDYRVNLALIRGDSVELNKNVSIKIS